MISEIPRGERLAKRVLLIGWDAADWKLINPLLDAGLMPTLEKFINRGVIGNLATLQPILSPMLWNSIATGKRPYKHGIYGFTELRPDGAGVQPVMSTSRKVKALWNILTQSGLTSSVFGWFASHPAEPINGVCASNLFHQSPKQLTEQWPLPPQSVHPERLAGIFANLRVHPTEIEGEHLQPFFPRASEIDQNEESGRKALNAAAKILADCSSIHAAATWTMENEPWDFCAIYYDAIDHFCHAFMPFHPPKQQALDEKLFELFRHAVNGMYRYHDMMLERLLQLAGEDTTVIIASDHGFHSDHLRPAFVPKQPTGPTVWHRPHGVFAMRGPGVLEDERIYGASILDIAPTILSLFGLPVADDMDGRPIVQAFARPPEIARIASWEDVPGEAGQHPRGGSEADPEAAKQALQQLVDLGYIAPLSDDEQKTIRVVGNEARYNLAASYLDAGRAIEAIEILEKLTGEATESRFAFALAQAYLNVGRLADARRTLEPLMVEPAANAAEDDAETSPTRARTEMLLGALAFEEGHIDEALVHLLEAEKANPRLARLHNQLGEVYLRRRRWSDAERAFRKAVAIDGDNARAYHGLSVALLRQDKAVEAAELALRAVGLKHFFPGAHFQLGKVLTRLNWPERAAQAFETGLTMRPNAAVAHRYLARLYGRLGQGEKARAHRQAIATRRSEAATAPAAEAHKG